MVLMRQRPELRGKLLVENSWDWQIVDELTPRAWRPHGAQVAL